MSALDDIVAALRDQHEKQAEIYRRASEEKERAWKARERAQDVEQKAGQASIDEYRKLQAIANAIMELSEATR